MTDLCRRCDRPRSEHTIGDQLCPGVLRFAAWPLRTDALARIEALEGALRKAIEIIDQSVPEEALGYNSMGNDEVPGGMMTRAIKDEYLHYMRNALQPDTPNE